MDLYEVEIITVMEDVKELTVEKEDRGYEEGRKSPAEGNEEDADEDLVSIELVELKERALRFKNSFIIAQYHSSLDQAE